MSADHTTGLSARHRCQPLHIVYGLVALLAGAGLLLQQPVMILFAFPLAVIARQVPRLVNGRTRVRPTAGNQAVGEAAPHPRRAWVVTAGLLDTVLVLCNFTICTVLLRGHGDVLVPSGRGADYLMLGGVVLFIAAHAYAHRRAAHHAGPARIDT
ncbi:hypothetical protein OG800_49610 (plasmid) [Streptomyces sp. NBC_00445]|uniref:hypothetical protein n=1 Tax=Streptomyces sp. NBC_00445 TaxID=2975745 RepID=UPI002E1FF586